MAAAAIALCSKIHEIRTFEMVLICQPPNAHVQISRILLRNTMAAVAVKKIYNGK
jgi:ABC-type uncharacterized transport system auxiliary subunit